MADRNAEVSDIMNAAAILLAAIVDEKGGGHVSQQTREQAVRQAIALRAEVEKQLAAER